MNLLLDTHVLLWWLDDPLEMDGRARKSIADGNNVVFISAAVIWEIRIKQALGKLIIQPDFQKVLEQEPFDTMPITIEHAHKVGDLPAYHRDPFDRMLVAQATVEKLTLVTHDHYLKKYGIQILAA